MLIWERGAPIGVVVLPQDPLHSQDHIENTEGKKKMKLKLCCW